MEVLAAETGALVALDLTEPKELLKDARAALRKTLLLVPGA